jgi:hypothetical protein
MVRSTRGEKLLERARKRHGTSLALLTRTRSAQNSKTHAPSAAADPATRTRTALAPEPADPSLDVALYGCECGLVFEAPVSTTVGCPHCGAELAW